MPVGTNDIEGFGRCESFTPAGKGRSDVAAYTETGKNAARP